MNCGREFDTHFFGLRPWNCPVCGIRDWEDEYSAGKRDGLPSEMSRTAAATAVAGRRQWTPTKAAKTNRAVFWTRWIARILVVAILAWALYYIVAMDWKTAVHPPQQTNKVISK